MRSVRLPALGVLAAFSLAACAVEPPAGPTVMAAPGKGQTFEQFRYADGRCRSYANSADNGVTPNQAATSSGVGSAVAGTALGAAAGALLGAASGSAGVGAAIGAGTGLLFGSAVGAGNAEQSGGAMQASYDRVYAQCMVASGQDVSMPPGFAGPVPGPVIVQSPPVVVIGPRPYPYGPYGYGGYGYVPYGYAPYAYHPGW